MLTMTKVSEASGVNHHTVETCIVSDQSVFQIFFGGNRHCVLQKDHPDSYQQQVQMTDFVILRGCVSALGNKVIHTSVMAALRQKSLLIF